MTDRKRIFMDLGECMTRRRSPVCECTAVEDSLNADFWPSVSATAIMALLSMRVRHWHRKS